MHVQRKYLLAMYRGLTLESPTRFIKLFGRYNCSTNAILVPDISERNYKFIQNDSSKENDRTFSHGWL